MAQTTPREVSIGERLAGVRKTKVWPLLSRLIVVLGKIEHAQFREIVLKQCELISP
jgi:hypothetical protein